MVEKLIIGNTYNPCYRRTLPEVNEQYAEQTGETGEQI
jgi:hypothetical protein